MQLTIDIALHGLDPRNLDDLRNCRGGPTSHTLHVPNTGFLMSLILRY